MAQGSGCWLQNMWFLQDGVAFVAPDFHGKEFDLGLRMPDASATGNRRILDFLVLGRKEGIVAAGTSMPQGRWSLSSS